MGETREEMTSLIVFFIYIEYSNITWPWLHQTVSKSVLNHVAFFQVTSLTFNQLSATDDSNRVLQNESYFIGTPKIRFKKIKNSVLKIG